MENKKLLKIFIVVAILIVLTFSNWCVLGNWTITMATTAINNIQATNNKNVKFDIGIKENSQFLHEKEVNINDKLILTSYLAVENDGYLKDISIIFEGENKNYVITNIKQEDEIVRSSSQEKINLNQIVKGKTVNLDYEIEWANNYIDESSINKKNIVRLIAVYVDANGKENKIEKSVELKINWICENEIKLESEITKYTNYELKNEKGIFIEQAVKIFQDADKKLPFEKAQLSIDLIKLDDKKADLVIVKRENTKVSYEIKENALEINEELKDSREDLEYIVRYVFKDTELEEDLELGVKVRTIAQIVSAKETKSAEIQKDTEKIQKIGNIIQIEEIRKNEISKGRLYANYNAQEPTYDTKFSTEYGIDISYKMDIEKIKLTDEGVYFRDNEGEEYKINSENVLYNSTKINKTQFDYIFGEEGYIEIFNLNDEQIAKIDKNSKIDENGNYYVVYEEKPNEIYLLTSLIQNEGKLYLGHDKTIRPNTEYQKEKIKKFKTLNDKLLLELFEKNEENAIKVGDNNIQNYLVETKTEAQISLNTNKLTSILKNENVEIKIELKNNNETRDLYINPKFEIEFPKGIKDITVKENNILFDDELQIESIDKIIRDEKLVLVITLKGEQSKFLLDEYINGTTLVLNTDIDIDIRTVSKTDSILMKYYNENAVSYNKEDHGEYEYKIEFISPKQMIVGQEISGYNKEEKGVISILQGEKSAKLEIYTDAKLAQNNIFVMNNNGYDCDGITILGRIPAKNNKDVLTGENLGTTINTKLVGMIQVEGLQNAQIYYSTNEGATTNLQLEENSWATDVENSQNAKSFMIVADSKIKQGDIFNIKYNFEIPANLEHNEYLYGDVGVYYRDLNNVEYIAKADKIEFTTGRGPQMEIKQQASVEKGKAVYEGQKIKYTITVKNTGIDPIYNLEIKELLPENAIYSVYTRNNLSLGYDEKNPNAKMLVWNMPEVHLGEEIKVEFNVEVNKLPSIEEYYNNQENFVEEGEKYFLLDGENKVEVTSIPEVIMKNRVAVNAKDLGKELYAEDYENIVKASEISATESSSVAEEVLLTEDDDLTYSIRIQNNKDEDIDGIKFEKILPEGLEYIDIYTIVYNSEYEEWERELEGSYNESERKVTINLGTIEKGEDIHIKLELKTSKLRDDEYKREIETFSKITGDNIKEYVVTPVKNTIAKPKIQTEYMCDNNSKYLTNGEVLQYTIKATNISDIIANNVKIEDVLPDELELIKATYSVGEFEVTTGIDSNNKVETVVNLQPNETMTLNIKAKTVSKAQNVTIENTPTVSVLDQGKSNIGTISHILERIEEGNSIVEEEIDRSYNISGTVWYDKDRNGINGETDNNLADVQLKIIDESNGNIVKELSSNSDGNYTVEGLEEGNYFVMFEYDNEKYDVTEYRKSGASEQQNSSVIQVNGQDNNLVAISDTIRISNNDFSNVNIGLTDKQKFDLKIDTSVTSITEQNEKDAKTHKYDNTKFAKIEINPDVLGNTTVYVEYKITVTNEGNVAGFAKNIIDYIPEGMTFNSELNTNWYIGNDGNLYTNALANEILRPGESKELKLILAKKMTEENTGMNLNIVEIIETYNELGLEDIDSKENNKVETEDDYSQAVALLTLQLGGNVGNMLAVIIPLVVLVAVVYIIRTQKIKIPGKKQKKYK